MAGAINERSVRASAVGFRHPNACRRVEDGAGESFSMVRSRHCLGRPPFGEGIGKGKVGWWEMLAQEGARGKAGREAVVRERDFARDFDRVGYVAEYIGGRGFKYGDFRRIARGK